MKMNASPVKITKNDGSSVQEAGKLFNAMHVLAWITLAIGLVLSLWNIRYFSDSNLTLMLGIGFLVGSVQIYVIGTAMQLFHQRQTKDAAER